jgi:glycosyltransferase involved in cell wall biosynthesis
MKVLHVINSLATGGAEKLLLETIPIYNKKGIKADVLLIKGNDSPFLSELKAQKCCSVFSLTKGTVYNVFLFFKIIPYLKNYEIIHVHLFPAQYFVVLAKWFSFSKVKLIFTEHSTSNRRMKNLILGWFDKWIYQSYDTIIAITENVEKSIKNHVGLNNNSIVVIENGVDLEKISQAKPLEEFLFVGQDEKSKVILQVSSLQEPKDQETLIKTALLLPDNFFVLLAGNGVGKIKLEVLVKELKLEKKVHFLGVRNDIPRLLKSVDFIVLSSKYEGLSLSSIEGMASGKPFIASNVPGLKEVVENAGVLFECGNEKELAIIILELNKDKKYYNKIVKQCEVRSKEYDIQRMIKKHIQLYETIAKR